MTFRRVAATDQACTRQRAVGRVCITDEPLILATVQMVDHPPNLEGDRLVVAIAASSRAAGGIKGGPAPWSTLLALPPDGPTPICTADAAGQPMERGQPEAAITSD